MRVNEGVGLQDSSRELTRGSLIFIIFHNLCEGLSLLLKRRYRIEVYRGPPLTDCFMF